MIVYSQAINIKKPATIEKEKEPEVEDANVLAAKQAEEDEKKIKKINKPNLPEHEHEKLKEMIKKEKEEFSLSAISL